MNKFILAYYKKLNELVVEHPAAVIIMTCAYSAYLSKKEDEPKSAPPPEAPHNHGIKARNSFSFGDQYVHFNVVIPTDLSQRQRQLIEEFIKEEQRQEDKGAAAGASG